jgi:hypothetical protein
MKFIWNIKIKDADIWQKWIDENIGVKGFDYFHVPEKVVTYFDDNTVMSEVCNHYIEIPDSKKALLWALRWS